MLGSRVSTPDISVPVALPRNPRYGSLDMWRGAACVAVVVYHACLFNYRDTPGDGVAGWILAVSARGWIGVPIFFVISGYCIFATADSARRNNHAIARYFVRRFRRIFPPYWACLAGTVVFALTLSAVGWEALVAGDFGDIASIPDLRSVHLGQWLGNVSLTETWRPHLVLPGPKHIVGPAWTLCYEEQFYAVSGLLLLLAPRRIFWGALLVSAAVALCTPFSAANTGFFWDGRWLLFAAGVGVYYATNYAGPQGTRALVFLLALGMVYDACRSLGWMTGPWKTAGLLRNEGLAACGFAIAILVLHRLDAALCAPAWVRPLHFCGRMCYSLYLVHYPIVLAISHGLFRAGVRSAPAAAALTIPLCLAVSLFVAWLFHLAVERHFLNPPTWQAPARDRGPQPAASAAPRT